MKFYLSGQITGLPPEEFDANFKNAQELMMDGGVNWEIINPVKIPACVGKDCGGKQLRVAGPEGSYEHAWQCYMKHDLIELLTCDAIVLLPNWRKSQGAKFELDVAIRVGMAVWFIGDDYDSYDLVFDEVR